MTKNDGMTLDRKMGVKQHGGLLTYKDRNLCGKMPVGSAEMCKQSPERNWVGGSSRFRAPSAWKKRPGAHGLRILACALALLLNSLTDLRAQAATDDAEAERISDLQRWGRGCRRPPEQALHSDRPPAHGNRFADRLLAARRPPYLTSKVEPRTR
jgi:hypothetical protein